MGGNDYANQAALILPHAYKSDFLAFSLIVCRIFWVRKKIPRHGVASILDTVVEDSTWYFLLVFFSHFTLVMTLNLARVCVTTSYSALWLIIFIADFSSRLSSFFQPRKLSQSYPETITPHRASLHYNQRPYRVCHTFNIPPLTEVTDAWAQVPPCYGLTDVAIIEESGKLATTHLVPCGTTSGDRRSPGRGALPSPREDNAGGRHHTAWHTSGARRWRSGKINS